jgi:hypothetical protein
LIQWPVFSLKTELTICLQEIIKLTWTYSHACLEPATPIHKAGRITIHHTEKYNNYKNTMRAVGNDSFFKRWRGL